MGCDTLQPASNVEDKLLAPMGSSVGIATGYGLDGQGIESRWGRYFPHLSRPALGPTQPPVEWSFLEVKSGRGVTLTPHPLLCHGQERVKLYLYSPYGPHGSLQSLSACTRVHFTFTFYWLPSTAWKVEIIHFSRTLVHIQQKA